MRFYVRGGFQSPADMLEIARRADELGYDGMTVPDHLFYSADPSTPYPYSETGEPPFPRDTPWPDVWVLIGAMAACTKRLSFRTNVYVLPLRNPLVVARAVGTAAVIGNGRVELGIGVGHLRDEFDALEADFEHRGARTDESIAILRAVLKPGPVSFQGKFWTFGPIFLHPAPDAPVPILVGGESKPALRRTAMLADGHVSLPHTMDDIRDVIANLTRLRKELAPEREPLTFHVDCTEAETADDYMRLAEAGAHAVKITTWSGDPFRPGPLQERLDNVARFADEVMSVVRARGTGPS